MNPVGGTTTARSANPKPLGTTADPGISRRRFIAAGAAVLSVPLVARSAHAQAKVLRISTPGSPDEWQSKGMVKFKEELERSAPGQFNVQLHFNGTLFAQGTEIEAMQRGNLEGALTSPQDITNLIPEFSIFTTGYLMRGPAHLDAVYDGDIGAEYKARVAKDVRVQIIRSQYLGTRHVILRQPRNVQTPADMAGLKLRMPGSETWQFLGAALGANPTPLAFEEVYLAMQTGTVDGLENPLPDAMAAKFYEVSKQVVLTGAHGRQRLLHARRRVLERPVARAAEGDRGRGRGVQEAERRWRHRDGENGRLVLRGQGRQGRRRPTSPRSGIRSRSGSSTRSSPRPGRRACSTGSTRPGPDRKSRIRDRLVARVDRALRRAGPDLAVSALRPREWPGGRVEISRCLVTPPPLLARDPTRSAPSGR